MKITLFTLIFSLLSFIAISQPGRQPPCVGNPCNCPNPPPRCGVPVPIKFIEVLILMGAVLGAVMIMRRKHSINETEFLLTPIAPAKESKLFTLEEKKLKQTDMLQRIVKRLPSNFNTDGNIS